MAHDLKTYYNNIMVNEPILLKYQFLCTFLGKIHAQTVAGGPADFATGEQNQKMTLLCQSATVPKHTMNTTNVNFFAKKFTLPTTQTYEHEWSCKYILTQNMQLYSALRGALLQYSNMYLNMGGQIRQIPNFDIQLDLLNQYSQTGSNVYGSPRFILKGAYPTNIGKLDFEYTDAAADVMTFDVKWTFQYSFIDRQHDGVSNDVLARNIPILPEGSGI